jgi:hypothetical protein
VLPADNQKIVKVLRKVERVIKPIQFRYWMDAVRAAPDFMGHI